MYLQKTKHVLVTKLLLLLVTITMVNCQKEDEPITTQATLLEQMQQSFNPNTFKETVSYEYEVDWNSTTPKQYSKELETSFYEFHLNYTSPLNPEALNKQRQEGYYIYYKLIATVNDNDEFKFYMAKFYQKVNDNTKNYSYSISINIDNGYKGVTHMFDIENDMVFAKRIEEDRIKNNPILLKKEFSDNDITNRIEEDCQMVTVYHYKDWYKVIDGIAIYTGKTQLLYTTTKQQCEYYWLPEINPDGGGGGGTYGKNSTDDSTYENCTGHKCFYEVEDSVIGLNNELTNPCASNLFTQLENGIYKDSPLKPEVQIPNSNFDLNFSEKILKIFTNEKYIDYTIKNATLTGKNGVTEINPGEITTRISNTYLSNATKLSIVRTMIHESVHAYIIYERSVSSGFETDIKAYAKANGYKPDGTNVEKNRFHHEFMGQYVDAMAYSLYEWDKTHGSGGNLGWDYYKNMAYGGLYYNDASGNQVETDSFKALVSSTTDRQLIKNILNNEAQGNANAKSSKCQ